MDKKTVMIGVLATGAFAMSGYTLISNAMEDISRKAYVRSLKQDQVEATNKINNLFDNYNSIDSSLTYYDAGIFMNMEKIDNTLSLLDSLSRMNKGVAEQLKELRHRQDGQAEELLEIRDDASATGGLGIITGEREEVLEAQPTAVLLEPVVIEPEPVVVEPKPVVIEPEPIAVLLEPVVVPSCPKAKSSVDFGKYLKNISFKKSVKFTVSFDIQDRVLTNVTFSEDISGKLSRAVTKYLNTAIPTDYDASNCSLPFTISV